jgi:molecular chaperone GrpE
VSDLTPDDPSTGVAGAAGPVDDVPSTDVSGASVTDPDAPSAGDDPSTDASEPSSTDPEDSGGDSVLDLMGVLEGERDSYLDDLQRVSAEFANFRKQAEKRSVEVAAVARGALAERLLPVLDACDLAIEHGDDGVVQIRSSLVNALEPAGLEVLDPVDQPFDPTLHEAVLHVPAEAGDDGQVVVEVLRRGYAWSGRVLRPAMVKVRG